MLASHWRGRCLLVVFALLFRMGLGVIGGDGAQAHADLLQCPYPATGSLARVQPVIGEAIGYVCTYPTERGKQHLRSEYGGYTTNGNIGGGGSNILGLGGNGSGGVAINIGLILWSQSWRCPDERYIASPPNGIGWWKDELDWKGVKCPAVSRAPLALDAPWPPVDPDIVVVVNSILPPGQPDPTAGPPGPDGVPGPPPEAAPAPTPGAARTKEGPPGTPGILNPAAPAPVPLTPQGNG